MGRLIDGEWTNETGWGSKDGKFRRSETQFRHTVQAGTRFAPDAGRYHLVVAAACPWCHRVMIARALFGLEDAITMSIVSPWMLEQGWSFDEPDPLFGAKAAHEFYTRADPTYSGRVTVPILWDREHQTIVNNESSELIRQFDTAFRPLHTREVDSWRPPEKVPMIDAINPWVYTSINNGVYRSGFATTQQAYDEAVTELFAALDRVEALLDGQNYLTGDAPTEADWRLWVTLIRFDLVYHGHFKCNLRRIADYPNLSAYTRRLYDIEGVAGTTDFESIKTHYYGSHTSINPHQIVPILSSPFA